MRNAGRKIPQSFPKIKIWQGIPRSLAAVCVCREMAYKDLVSAYKRDFLDPERHPRDF